MFDKLTKKNVESYKNNKKNLDLKGKLKNVTGLQINQITINALDFNAITEDQVKDFESELQTAFKNSGLYGQGNQINSNELEEVRKQIKITLESLVNNKTLFFRDNVYHNVTNSGKIAVIECNVIVKHLTKGQLYHNTDSMVDLKDKKAQVISSDYVEHFKIRTNAKT